MKLALTLAEKIIPLRMAWAAANGYSTEQVSTLNRELLFEMPDLLLADSAVILGSTRATSFSVHQAVKRGHSRFVLIGNKPVSHENAKFTGYIKPRMDLAGIPMPPCKDMSERAYARFLLESHYGISANRITEFDTDRSTNSGANMRVLKDNGFARKHMIEMFTLAGTARRILMTARRELGDGPVISVHNAYPCGVTRDNWTAEPVAHAHIESENSKALGDSPLYVRLGYCEKVDVSAEIERCNAAMDDWRARIWQRTSGGRKLVFIA